MKTVLILCFTFFVFSPTVSALSEKIVKESITSQGKKRTYYLFVPETLKPGAPAPLVVLLHGSNRNGLSLVEKWKDLAKKEGIILVGPDAAESSHWSTPEDGPEFLYELVESLRAKYPINPRRVYLFGHSAGAAFALLMALFESEYFAATAIHAGALQTQDASVIDVARRKMPISIQVGTNDAFFPLAVVRATRDAFNARGFAVELTEIAGHDHWYYDLAPKINQSAWDFLKKHELAAEPRFEPHRFGSGGGRKSKEAGEAFNRGLARHRAGDTDGAIAEYTRALELDENLAQAYNNRGVAYLSQSNYQSAVSDFSRSIKINPNEADTYSNRGNAYRALKKFDEAIADHNRALELKPSAEAFYNRGVSHAERGAPDLALADYTRAVELDPKFAQAYANRGILLLRQGRDAEAERDFDIAFQLDARLRSELEAYIKQMRAARGVKQP